MPYDKTTPKRAGIWENLGTSHLDVSQVQKPWLREALTSGEVYRSHLLLAFVVLGALLLIFDALGGFTPHPRPPGPGELDLAGAWKVHVGDGDAFAEPGFDDAAWCRLGVPSPLADPSVAAGCPPPAEMLRRMRGAVFWYRRSVEVPAGVAWREPSLFLGEVRSRARVYWDGAFLGAAVPEQNPVTLAFEPRQVAAGRHVLAVRFAGGGEEAPGLQHGGRRGVVLGELANSLPTGTDRRRLGLAAALWAALLQVVAFAFLLLLTVQARGGYRELLWLALFFGSTFVYALYHLALEPFAWYLRTVAVAGWSMALLGYGVSLYARDAAVRRRLDLLWLALWLFQVLAVTAAFSFGALGSRWLAGWRLAAMAAPFVVYAGVALAGGWRRDAGRRESRPVQTTTLALLLALYLGHLLDDLAAFALPGPLGSPFFLPLLSCLVFYFAAESYTEALRSVAFYGRFIRPGLKRLLELKGRSIFSDEKLFRGRKAVIMKIDMANYTRTTFDMPYGMRRLFQDLWFTLIDQVVADKVFLDKSLGDGSVYCFEDSLPGGSATAALRAALEIRERQVRRFDETYRHHLAEMLRDTPELEGPANVYLERYAQKNGRSLWERSTQIRIALVAGYVDEGLWGLSSQSHYDVQGGPLILATRLEAAARNGEIVFDDRFREEMEEESPGLLDPALLEERTVDLKGIGSWQIWVLPTHVDPFGAPVAERAGTV